ncbi:MAG TPA: ATP synthase F1 subunit gamma [Candidatus Paceibacterota bacterium]|nr:ATP synthase F1 subunit gamma [Candidatus Paceibacterota bacterium]
MALKHIKLKIQSVKKTSTVTRAMEAVSAVKMRKAQERALSGRAYAAAALTILERLSGSQEIKAHPLSQRLPGKTAVVLITSDKGLAGALNSNVIRTTERELEARGLTKDSVVMIALGRRGADYFANRGYDVRIRHENVSDGISESEMRMVTDTIVEWHEKGEIAACLLSYMNFLSTFEQRAAVRQILPLTPELIRDMVKGIVPAKGKYSGVGEGETHAATYTIEPDAESIINVLMPRLLNVAVYHGLLEAKASEHSARMVAMKNATDKAKEIATGLTRVFNKARQAAITREVSEITSGIEAMR